MTQNQLPEGKKSPTTDQIPFIYPAHWEADVVLRDGATAHLRPVLPTDQEALKAMYSGQSERTIYLRFFAPKPELSAKELALFTTVDHIDRVAFVLYLGQEMIGIGRYDRTNDPREAEVAFMISDRHHGRGIGSILLEHLAAAAHERGIERFAAEVLPENRPMLNVFADAGYEISREFEDGLVMVQFDIDPTDRSREVMEAREHRAEALSISELLAPQSLVVVGDSASWAEKAEPMLQNLLEGGFTGQVFALCLDGSAPDSEDYRALGSFEEADQGLDLAILTLPLEKIFEAVETAGQAGIRGCLIHTVGYADDGARGRARQKALVRSARAHGMRIIGPESFGLLNNAPSVRLDATLTQIDPKPGKLGLFSQSAAIGAVFSNTAVRRNLGVSSLVSAGNRADVSGNDIMQYWEDDPQTKVCALYLESIGNPRKFSRIARRLSRTKPVIVTKNAFTGLQLPPGHSGRTSIAPTQALDAMLSQAGVIPAESSEQLLDLAQILVTMPLPANRRIAVLSNSAALAQIVADRASARKIEVKYIESKLVLGSQEMQVLQEVLDAALESSDIDALVAVFLTEGFQDPTEVAQTLLEAARTAHKPVLGIFPGITDKAGTMQGIFGQDEATQESGEVAEQTEQISALPCYNSPMQAIDALASIMDYVDWRQKEEGNYSSLSGLETKEANKFISELMGRVEGEELYPLDQADTRRILSYYGIDLLPSLPVTSDQEALAAVAQVGGYPVVLKSTDEFLGRRLDLGGIRLNIEDDAQLRHELSAIQRTLSHYGMQEVILQEQVAGGQAAVLQAIEDPLLGPVISFGMSGDATSLLGDWAHCIPPLTKRDIDSLVRTPKAAARLLGENELAAVRLDLLEELVARLAALKDNHPEIAHLQLAPIILNEAGMTVANARMKLGNPQQRTDSARRTMSRN